MPARSRDSDSGPIAHCLHGITPSLQHTRCKLVLTPALRNENHAVKDPQASAPTAATAASTSSGVFTMLPHGGDDYPRNSVGGGSPPGGPSRGRRRSGRLSLGG